MKLCKETEKVVVLAFYIISWKLTTSFFTCCLLFCQFQIWVYGSSFESFLVAVVNPNQPMLERWAEENHISSDFQSLCEDARAKEYIIGELNKVAKEKKVLSVPPFVFFQTSNLLSGRRNV